MKISDHHKKIFDPRFHIKGGIQARSRHFLFALGCERNYALDTPDLQTNLETACLWALCRHHALNTTHSSKFQGCNIPYFSIIHSPFLRLQASNSPFRHEPMPDFRTLFATKLRYKFAYETWNLRGTYARFRFDSTLRKFVLNIRKFNLTGNRCPKFSQLLDL